MSINQVAIIVNENEQTIRDLAHEMHIWVAATEKNKSVVEALWKEGLPEELTATHYEIPTKASRDEMCVIAIDLVENHHSSLFGAAPWLEIQVHGCSATKKLVAEFKEFRNVEIEAQEYGFSVTRKCE
jgi:hypothetical protein